MIIEKVGESVEVKFKRSKFNFDHRIRGVIPVTGYTVEGLDDTYPKIFLVKLPNREQWEICEYHTGRALPVGGLYTAHADGFVTRCAFDFR